MDVAFFSHSIDSMTLRLFVWPKSVTFGYWLQPVMVEFQKFLYAGITLPVSSVVRAENIVAGVMVPMRPVSTERSRNLDDKQPYFYTARRNDKLNKNPCDLPEVGLRGEAHRNSGFPDDNNNNFICVAVFKAHSYQVLHSLDENIPYICFYVHTSIHTLDVNSSQQIMWET